MTCEDFPCCGHEIGDCEDKLYPSSEDIWANPAKYHLGCDHNTGYCEYAYIDDDDEDGE